MNRRPSYGNKIGEALSRDGELRVQLDHIMAIARVPEAIGPFLALLSEISLHEPPVRSREFEDDDVAKAVRKVVAKMARDPVMGEVLTKEVARELGVKPDRVKL